MDSCALSEHHSGEWFCCTIDRTFMLRRGDPDVHPTLSGLLP